MSINQVRELIDKSNQIVVLAGTQMILESGLKGVRQEEEAYDIEKKYGYSPEEIVTEEFLNRRSSVFYQYYREDILDMNHLHPTKAHEAIARLEQRGKLRAVITRSVYGLNKMAGIKNVIELHGSVYRNYCPKCGKQYGPEYIVNSKDVPKCEKCRVMLTPGIALYGSAIDNGLISMTAEAVCHADMLMIVGSSTHSNLTQYLLQYYNGCGLVTINHQPGPGDELANYTLYGSCQEILSQLM